MQHILYFISAGNDNALLKLERTNSSQALIIAAARLDREMIARQLITVKCFKYGTNPKLNQAYNRLVRYLFVVYKVMLKINFDSLSYTGLHKFM